MISIRQKLAHWRRARMIRSLQRRRLRLVKKSMRARYPDNLLLIERAGQLSGQLRMLRSLPVRAFERGGARRRSGVPPKPVPPPPERDARTTCEMYGHGYKDGVCIVCGNAQPYRETEQNNG